MNAPSIAGRPASRRAPPVLPASLAKEPRHSVPISMAELVAHRPYLVRFAMKKLRDPALAEDAVHDVLEAVLSGRAVFSGRAALRSWLTAVLKHKIVDSLRRHRAPRRARRRRRRRRRPCGRLPAAAPRRDRRAAPGAGARARRHRALAGDPARRDAAARDRGALDRVGLRRARHQRGEPVRARPPRAKAAAVLRRSLGAAARQIIAAGSKSSAEKRVSRRGRRCTFEPVARPRRSRSACQSARGISTST